MIMVNVRGSHGSGKTTISQRLISEHPHQARVEPTFVEGIQRGGKREGEPYHKNFKKPNAFVIEGGLVVVGRWQSGLDGMLPHDTIEDVLRYWAPRANLVWENILVSANIGRWGRLAQELEPVNHSIWANLDTPFKLSTERVMARRAEARAAGFKHRQADADVRTDLHEAHWKRCRRVAVQAAPNFDVRWLRHELAYELVHDVLIREGGWECRVHGLFLPEGPFLTRWTPDEIERECVHRTYKLPWELPSEAPALITSPELPNEASAVEVATANNRVHNGDVAVAIPTFVASTGTIQLDPYELGDPFDG